MRRGKARLLEQSYLYGSMLCYPLLYRIGRSRRLQHLPLSVEARMGQPEQNKHDHVGGPERIVCGPCLFWLISRQQLVPKLRVSAHLR